MVELSELFLVLDIDLLTLSLLDMLVAHLLLDHLYLLSVLRELLHSITVNLLGLF